MIRVLIALALASGVAAGENSRELAEVHASVETEPVASPDDAADDPAIWVHPDDPSQSLVLGTDKQQGILVHDLRGETLQVLPLGRINNVDLRHAVRATGGPIDLVVGTNRTDNSVVLLRVEPRSRRLVPAAPDRFPSGLDGVYGVALHREPASGHAHVFASRDAKPPETGVVRHWRLSAELEPVLVRSLPFRSRVEGLVCDDEAGILYAAEEDEGIWAIAIDPGAAAPPRLVEPTRPSGPLVADVEGLTIVHGAGGDGFLIASSQGNSTFAVFRRAAPNRHLLSFRIADADACDGAEETDGIDAVGVPLGPGFPRGVFIAQDGANPGANQNFKLVPWDRIAALLPAPAAEDPAPR
jgi:3-phytase